jgi:hypothetical protein
MIHIFDGQDFLYSSFTCVFLNSLHCFFSNPSEHPRLYLCVTLSPLDLGGVIHLCPSGTESSIRPVSSGPGAFV